MQNAFFFEQLFLSHYPVIILKYWNNSVKVNSNFKVHVSRDSLIILVTKHFFVITHGRVITVPVQMMALVCVKLHEISYNMLCCPNIFTVISIVVFSSVEIPS